MAEAENEKGISDFIGDLKNIIVDRFSSPFLTSLSVSWAITNFQLFMIIFSSAKLGYKIQLVKWYTCSDLLFHITHFYLIPIATAFAYTFAYPFFNRKVQKFITERKMEERADRLVLEKLQVFTLEEVDAIHLRNGKEITRLKNEISRLKDRETQLELQLEEQLSRAIPAPEAETEQGFNEVLKSKNPKPKTSSSIKNDLNLSFDEKRVLTFMADQENQNISKSYEQDMLASLSISIVDTKIALDSLSSKDYIRQDYDDGVCYFLEPLGRIAYKQLKAEILI